jgi:trimethylamine--corrinoid protein Co-methyltransferase
MIRPKIEILDDDQKKQINDYSIRILHETGVKIESEKALNLLKQNPEVRVDGQIAYFSANVIDRALRSLPTQININCGFKKQVISVGEDSETLFGVGVTNLFYDNNGVHEKFTKEHTAIASGLCNTLENYDLLSTPGVVQNVDESLADLHSTAAMLANTEKPLVLLISDEKQTRDVFRMVEEVRGKPKEYHSDCLLYVNPVTPLVINNETIEKIYTASEFNIPVIYSNYGMYGATTPITVAGSAALMNAELLAGVVLSQHIKEGMPMILGSMASSFDMATMGSLYTPKTMLLNSICAEMMDYYMIPHAGASGSGPGWGGDISGSGILTLNHYTSLMTNAGIVPFVGGCFDSTVFSPEFVVYSDHIISLAKDFMNIFEISDQEVGIDEIINLGPGANFLTSELTLNKFTEETGKERIWENYSLERWIEAGKPDALQQLKKKTKDILDSLHLPQDNQKIASICESFISKIKS